MRPLLAATLSLSCVGASAAACAGQDRLAARPDLARLPAARLPPHAESFEFALPDPGPRRPLMSYAARLPVPTAVSGLVRADVRALRSADLPTDTLAAGLRGADCDVADACGLLLGIAGGAGAEKTLADAILDRGRRGEDPTGCALGLLACGGGRAADWLERLCLRPTCPAGFSLGVLRAADIAIREPELGVSRGRTVALAASLLDARPVADAAADRLIDWRAWDRAEDVLRACVAEDDPDPVRGRAFRVACVRFALACAADPAAGTDGARCRRWLGDVRAADPDLLRRAELTSR